MIPEMKDVNFMQRQWFFKEMDDFSKEFHKDYPVSKIPMLDYWSRRWEYPFVYKKIVEHIGESDEFIEMLDAGCGFTFFPFFMAQLNEVFITAYDLEDYGAEYSKIKKDLSITNISFVQGDLKDLSRFKDDSFDVIYSVSVLEHTGGSYDKQFREIKRVLKDDGIFVITFDISLDEHGSITPFVAQELVYNLNRHFKVDFGKSTIIDMLSKDILSTLKSDKKIRPWAKESWWHRLRNYLWYVKRGLKPVRDLNITVFGGVYKKVEI